MDNDFNAGCSKACHQSRCNGTSERTITELWPDNAKTLQFRVLDDDRASPLLVLTRPFRSLNKIGSNVKLRVREFELLCRIGVDHTHQDRGTTTG